MPALKLSKLPVRTPVKVTFTASPELHRALQAYAELYRETYGEAEPVAELIPYMLESFLATDRGFVRATKRRQLGAPAANGASRRRHATRPDAPSSPAQEE